jgi:hypothetical protein
MAGDTEIAPTGQSEIATTTITELEVPTESVKDEFAKYKSLFG